MRRARFRLAPSIAAFGWFLGLYGVPYLHNLDHKADHTHGGAEPARLPPHEEDHTHPHPEPRPVPLDSEHGAGSALHFSVAALEEEAPEPPAFGHRIPLPPSPSPSPAPAVPLRALLARGPPSIDAP